MEICILKRGHKNHQHDLFKFLFFLLKKYPNICTYLITINEIDVHTAVALNYQGFLTLGLALAANVLESPQPGFFVGVIGNLILL